MTPWYERKETWIAVLCLLIGAACKIWPTGVAHEALEYVLIGLGGGGGIAAMASVNQALFTPVPGQPPASPPIASAGG